MKRCVLTKGVNFWNSEIKKIYKCINQFFQSIDFCMEKMLLCVTALINSPLFIQCQTSTLKLKIVRHLKCLNNYR